MSARSFERAKGTKTYCGAGRRVLLVLCFDLVMIRCYVQEVCEAPTEVNFNLNF